MAKPSGLSGLGASCEAKRSALAPNTHLGDLKHPVTMMKPTSTQLSSPIVSARWAACEHFHKAVVARRRSCKRAQHWESKSGEHSSLGASSKGAPKAPSESGAQTFSESADEWVQFGRSADEAAAASRKAKSSGWKRDKSGKSSGGPKYSKSSAGTAAKSGSGKGSKRMGKEAGLTEKPRWDSLYEIPKRPAPDTSVSSGTRTPRKADKLKRPKKKIAKQSFTPNQGVDSKAKAERGPAFLQPSSQSDLLLDHWASHCPGDDIIPANAERVEWAAGLVLFQGTRHFPLISFETELKARRQVGRQLRLWRTELIEHDHQSLDSLRMVGGLVSPRPADLPRLPPWAVPNGWDYWGCPWAYMDAPSGHREVGVSSTLSPHSSKVTVIVLVDFPHEPQLLPDKTVAHLHPSTTAYIHLLGLSIALLASTLPHYKVH